MFTILWVVFSMVAFLGVPVIAWVNNDQETQIQATITTAIITVLVLLLCSFIVSCIATQGIRP